MRSSAALLGFSFLVSKILGLLRDNLLAARFGAGLALEKSAMFDLDVYYAAFRLPDLLFTLLSFGVLSAAFVPMFIEIREREGSSKAYQFTNEVLAIFGFAILILSSALYFLTPALLRLFVPGFSGAKLDIAIDITRMMLITPVLFTIGSIAGGVQNSYHKFLGIALAPVLYNLGIIGGILWFSQTSGVYGIALGVIAGAFLNMAVQIPGILKLGFRLSLRLPRVTSEMKELIKLSLPRIFGMSVTQFSLIVDTIIASTLVTGSISVINFASNIESVPISLVGVSIAIVSFGTLSELVANQKNREFIETIKKNIQKILFLLIPITLGMLALRFQIVRLLLGRGKFGWEDTAATADTLGIFLSGLLFGGLVFLLSRAFYAMKNTKTPVLVGIIAVLVNISSSIVFTKIFDFGTYGLAAGNSLADITNAVLLILLLSKHLKTSIIHKREIGKFIIASIFMLIIVQATKSSFGFVFDDIDTYAELALQTFTSIGIGALTYFGCLRILKSEEML